MNEDVFKEILAKAVVCEFAEFDNTPEHNFSLKHRLAMKRIFARYERNIRKLRKNGKTDAPLTNVYKPQLNLKQRLIIVTVIVVLMTLLVGWVIIFVSGNFRGTVYPDKTHFAVTDIEGTLQTIEYNYNLISVPEGFEIIETSTSPIHIYTLYMNNLTKQTITLHQWVKSSYESNYNTENHVIEDVIINGCFGFCIDFSDDKHNSSLVIWDNGDYIIEIIADIDKNSIINLSKIDKVLIQN